MLIVCNNRVGNRSVDVGSWQAGVTLDGFKRFIDEVGKVPGALDEEQAG